MVVAPPKIDDPVLDAPKVPPVLPKVLVVLLPKSPAEVDALALLFPNMEPLPPPNVLK